YIENIWLGDDGRFYAGQGGAHIDVIFKLYPWEHLAREDNADAIFADPGLRDVFTRDGALLVGGDALVQPALARSLRRMATDPHDFYAGDIARSLVETL
ncbi:gamma-glutamyltransferase, partial [Escherichia coli]